MVRVTLSPEGVSSFRRLPDGVKLDFDVVLREIQSADRLRLPGSYRVHQIEGGLKLWTLKVGPYRGIFRWDGSELRFIRFGRRERVYHKLPK